MVTAVFRAVTMGPRAAPRSRTASISLTPSSSS